MSDPRHFTATDGTVSRVFDTMMQHGVTLIAPPPAREATARIFRRLDGPRRLYQIETDADRATDDVTLERQLRAAQYLPTPPRHAGPTYSRPWRT